MAQRKTFHGKDVSKAQIDPNDRPGFAIGDEEFDLLPYLPVMSLDGRNDIAFLRAVISDDDVPRLERVLSDKRIIIEPEVTRDICMHVVEVLTGRPTVEPFGSANGQNGTPSSSEQDSSTPASTGS